MDSASWNVKATSSYRTRPSLYTNRGDDVALEGEERTKVCGDCVVFNDWGDGDFSLLYVVLPDVAHAMKSIRNQVFLKPALMLRHPDGEQVNFQIEILEMFASLYYESSSFRCSEFNLNPAAIYRAHQDGNRVMNVELSARFFCRKHQRFIWNLKDFLKEEDANNNIPDHIKATGVNVAYAIRSFEALLPLLKVVDTGMDYLNGHIMNMFGRRTGSNHRKLLDYRQTAYMVALRSWTRFFDTESRILLADDRGFTLVDNYISVTTQKNVAGVCHGMPTAVIFSTQHLLPHSQIKIDNMNSDRSEQIFAELKFMAGCASKFTVKVANNALIRYNLRHYQAYATYVYNILDGKTLSVSNIQRKRNKRKRDCAKMLAVKRNNTSGVDDEDSDDENRHDYGADGIDCTNAVARAQSYRSVNVKGKNGVCGGPKLLNSSSTLFSHMEEVSNKNKL
jgi:hypothetical protein